jgi:carboxymethylenebutenolidase
VLNLAGMSAYVARPSRPGPDPGVVILHLIFGLDAESRACADRLAAAGFVAIVPDQYHRVAPGTQLARTPEGRTRGLELLQTLSRDGVTADVAACLAWLRAEAGTTPRAGLLGLSSGAHAAFVAASRLDLAATVALFPGWLTGTQIPLSNPAPTLSLAPQLRGRLLFLVGELDHVVPPADVREIAAALAGARVPHEVVSYPGEGHGFFPGPRPGQTPAAEDAWRRIVELFERELRG